MTQLYSVKIVSFPIRNISVYYNMKVKTELVYYTLKEAIAWWNI